MKKILLILIFLPALSMAIDISILNSEINLGTVPPDSGFYGAQPGNINLKISNKTVAQTAEVYAEIDSPLLSPEGYQLPADTLQWQIYWWTNKEVGPPYSVDISSSAGFNSWVPYRRSPARVLRILSGVTALDIQLGTTVRRVPSVQPEGVYATKVRFTVTE